MVKAVFTTKVIPAYDDLPEVRYNFPRTYLRQAEAALNDWIIYYEPRRTTAAPSSRGGRQSYFAIARVVGIEPDPTRAEHYYAYVSDYLDLDRAVSFREGGDYYESALKRDDGATNKGAFGRAVRSIPDAEFDRILAVGFTQSLPAEAEHAISPALPPGIAEPFTTFDVERAHVLTTLSRPFRDEAFRRQVRAAYDCYCAMSGLKLINGGGRPEVQAAHIKPVAHSGPDSVRNGLALSGTLHWMFDRGLISVAEDHSILRAANVPTDVGRLIRPEGRLLLPNDETFHPHPAFLKFHREHVFKG
ncbi:HNH endonuclease family protein [Hyphomicrobium sulfonivorans]|uniref:HNH endonuclease family protein n=1 Tax=Hyphomicrobium sulfonivorans TaxID=121290 RepID=A0A109BML4_HYPSL|nr:HNH endonuclease [Hyphomicrobium sulfonivorans]KWT71591.1 HNH endonuclease family protein [Hyphomicrobium sulfonivorans]